MNEKAITDAVSASLLEDIGSGDITAILLPQDQHVTAMIVTHEPAIVCGRDWAQAVYQQLDPDVKIHWQVAEGEKIYPEQRLALFTGKARSIVTGERCALNWLQTLSGTATVVADYVAILHGTHTRLRDTRKTIPGLRYAQKYAVSCGGGVNHRMGLYDAYLIKENHIMSCGSIAAALQQACALKRDQPIQIEVENLDEFAQALACEAPEILLDNFTIVDMEKAVAMNQRRAILEVSGDVSLTNIRAIAETGVDFVAVGAITKHVRAIDFAMRLINV